MPMRSPLYSCVMGLISPAIHILHHPAAGAATCENQQVAIDEPSASSI